MSTQWLRRIVPRLLGMTVLLLAITLPVIIGVAQVHADSVDLYWYPDSTSGTGTGNWSATGATGHWATSPAGAGLGHAAPTATNSAFFTSTSFNGAGQTVTVDVAYSPLFNMDWTGATNHPTLQCTAALLPYGSITTIADMTFTGTSMSICGVGAGHTITTNGCVWNVGIDFSGVGTYTLQDNYNGGSKPVALYTGTLVTNNKTMTFENFRFDNGTTLTLGSSIINCSLWDAHSGTPTLTVNTATINCSNNFNGSNLITYHTVNLTNNTSTITGSNTFSTLGFTRVGIQTITFTDGTTQTVTTLSRDAGTSVKTLQGSGAGGWNITKAGGGYSWNDYLSISRSTASPATTFYAGTHSTNGLNNSQWTFNDAPAVDTTQAATAVTMDKDGVTGGIFNGNVTDSGGPATVSTWFDYGLTGAYGSTTTPADHATGAYTGTIPNNLTPAETYHYRGSASNGAGTASGADTTFTMTMPSVSTLAFTSPNLRGEITNMGVATSCYVYFNWGYSSGTMTHKTADQTVVGAGVFTYDMHNTNFISDQPIYFEAVVRVGAVLDDGADLNFDGPINFNNFPGLQPILLIIPLLVVVMLMGGIVAIFWGAKSANITAIIFGIFATLIGVVSIGIIITTLNGLFW